MAEERDPRGIDPRTKEPYPPIVTGRVTITVNGALEPVRLILTPTPR